MMSTMYDIDTSVDILQNIKPKAQYERKIAEYMSNPSYVTEIYGKLDITDTYFNVKKNIEIQEFCSLLNENFDFEVKSITELESDDRVSLVFNTDLPDLLPEKIGKINDEVFELFDKQNYKTIEAVMVL